MSRKSINYQSPSFYGLKMLLTEFKVFLKFQLRRMKKVKRTPELINDIYEKIRKNKLISLKKMSFETYIHGGNTLRWCLIDNKVCFGIKKTVHLRKLSILESIFLESNAETVIEFGSGDGSNLLFLAKRYPKTRFIGLELSQSSVELSVLAAKKFGINNVSFLQTDLTEVKSYNNLLKKNCFVYSMHTLEEMPRIFKIPVSVLSKSEVETIAFFEPAYIFSFKRGFLDIARFIRIINKDRLWGLITACKRLMHPRFNIDIIDLGLGIKPENPTTLIIVKRNKN